MTEPNHPAVTPLQRFRGKYSRIDYYPHNDTVEIIDRLRVKYPKVSVRQLLDLAVEKGAKALFPEMKR